ncbi:arginine--tRNA ligase, partial [archaeon]|nr:arginine--tRNA ligase [archaeon]
MDFKQEIIKILKKETKLKEIHLEVPPEGLGDYAFPCFILSKKLKKNPNEIAETLSKKIKSPLISRVEVKGPYLNFFVDKTKFIGNTLKKILKEKNYGSSNLGKGKKALMEHTSINPNASPHVGRSRNAIIGDSLSRILKFQNYKLETHYYVNNIGKQIAMLVLAYQGKKPSFETLLKNYVEINKKMESDPKIEPKVFELLNKIEQKDPKIKKEFDKVVDVCIKGQSKILSELDIKYNVFDYESKYLWNDSSQDVLKKLEKTDKVFIDEEGRKILDQSNLNLAMKNPLLVLTRGDKSSLYVLRDLAYHIDKMSKTENNFVVLGEDHKLYFNQLKEALKLLKCKAPKVIHYSFILLKEGKMSTRKGNLVLLTDFMEEAVKRAKKELTKRKSKNISKLSKSIGYAALKFAILKVSPEKNILFSWDNALNFEGETGPYIQYTKARIQSIIKKSKNKKQEFKLNDDLEIKLVKLLENFPKVVKDSTLKYKPNLIANY